MTYRLAKNGIQWYVEQEAVGRDAIMDKGKVITKVFYSEKACKDYISEEK